MNGAGYSGTVGQGFGGGNGARGSGYRGGLRKQVRTVIFGIFRQHMVDSVGQVFESIRLIYRATSSPHFSFLEGGVVLQT